MKPHTKRLILRALSTLLLLYLVVLIYNYVSCWKDIVQGELVYERNIGWLDLNHARPDGVHALLSAGTVHEYRQFMRIPFLDQEVFFGSEVTLDSSYSNRRTEAMSFLVFQSISNHFEDLQGKLPFYWLDVPFSSSYAQGDIAGNIVSFYCALNQVHPDTLYSKLELVSTAEALALFLRETNFKQRAWEIERIDNYLSSLLRPDQCGEMLRLTALNKEAEDRRPLIIPNYFLTITTY